jgi:enoyl-CoA hydratase
MSIVVNLQDRVASVMIDREHRRNALDNEALEGLIKAFEGFRHQEVTAVVISGKGSKAFSAGGDLKATYEYTEREAQYHSHLWQKCTETIALSPYATIAAIEGYCLGGGLELALTCDYRIASAEAQFGFPEITFNAVATGGGAIRAPRAIGLSRAREMLIFGNRIDAAKAMAWNLVSEIVEPGTAVAAAMKMAKAYAEKVNPLAVATLKQILVGGYGSSTSAGQSLAYLADGVMMQKNFFREGLASVAYKGKPDGKA